MASAFTSQNLGRYFESKVVNHNPQDKGYKGLQTQMAFLLAFIL